MTKARRPDRRGGPGGARSRRTPVRAARGRGLRLPWIPIAVVVGIAAVVGVIVYLVIQAGQPAGERHEEARRIEADANPDLPGEFVNLPEIYGGAYGEEGANTAGHVRRDVDYKTEQDLPPAGGPHWGASGCGREPDDAPANCGPVDWGIYREPWDAESLVHNMEHAGVVAWYNTKDQSIIDQLEDWAGDNEDRFLVLTPYPDMEPETIAITAWSRRDKFPAGEFDKDRLQRFLDKHECRFDPEGLC